MANQTLELWTRKEVAQRTRFCERIIQRWTNEDGMPCIRVGEKSVRYEPERVLEWLRKRQATNQ